jgi:hypothetical protein
MVNRLEGTTLTLSPGVAIKIMQATKEIKATMAPVVTATKDTITEIKVTILRVRLSSKGTMATVKGAVEMEIAGVATLITDTVAAGVDEVVLDTSFKATGLRFPRCTI